MSGELYNYDVNSISVSFKGVVLTGFTKDSKVKIEIPNDLWVEDEGCSGEVTRSKQTQGIVLAKVMLKCSSPSNDFLDRQVKLDYRSNAGVGPFTIKDALGTTNIVTSKAYIKKQPNLEFNREAADREWTLVLINPNITQGGNIPA